MTEYSAHRVAHHAAHIRGLTAYINRIAADATRPVPDYLPSIVPVASPAVLAEIAISNGLDGPHRACDGSYYLAEAFGGGVTWQAVAYAEHTGASRDEQHARAWAAGHGCVIVRLADLIGQETTP